MMRRYRFSGYSGHSGHAGTYRRFRPALVLATLALTAGMQVHAADWAPVTTGDGNQHFYDRSKVFVNADEITFWRRVVFATAHPVKNGFARSAMYRERLQCRQHRITTLGYLLYSSDGTVLENVYTPDAEASAVVPETVGDRFQRVMCAMTTGAADTPPAPPPKETTPASKKNEGGDEVRQEIDRLEMQLKRLRERLGDRAN